jgi:hypothetical protein
MLGLELDRSDHFTVGVPRSWEVVRPTGSGSGPAIARRYRAFF